MTIGEELYLTSFTSNSGNKYINIPCAYVCVHTHTDTDQPFAIKRLKLLLG